MERIVVGAVPNEVVWKRRGEDGYEHMSWLPVREEIVRCKDCKHYIDHAWVWLTDVGDICRFWNSSAGVKVEPDGFCKWGERMA